MIKVYKMPNGKKYRYDEKEAPEVAVLCEKKLGETAERPVEPKAKEVPNKAKIPANKAKKATKK